MVAMLGVAMEVGHNMNFGITVKSDKFSQKLLHFLVDGVNRCGSKTSNRSKGSRRASGNYGEGH